MEKLNFRSFLIIFLFGLFIFACHREAIQPTKEPTEPPQIPECKKNYTRGGNWIAGLIYKTWVKYDNLDFNKALSASVKSLQTYGHRILSIDREGGTISAEMVTTGGQTMVTYPINVMILRDKSSLIIHLNFRTYGGAIGTVDLCSFYTKLEEIIGQEKESPKPKPPPEAPKKPPEVEKQPPQPAPRTPQETPSRATQVTVSSENLRDKPQGKIIGKIYKGATLIILEDKESWLRVRLEDGTEAWIWKKSTSEGSKAAPPPPPQEQPKSVM